MAIVVFSTTPLETDPVVRRYRDSEARFHERLAAIRAEIDSLLGAVPSEEGAAQLSGIKRELEGLFRDNLEQTSGVIGHLRKLEESKRRSEMAEKRSSPQRNRERSQAQVQELSEQLNTKLRLDRVDAAMKELLDFLADAEFFAANASTGRRRRLRALQNTIEKSLEK